MSLVVPEALPADPLEALGELARGDAELDRLRRAQVRAAREAGVSWEQIGHALGVSKQSAWEHFTRDIRDVVAANASANATLDADEAMALAVGEVKAVRRRRSRAE